MSAKRLRCPLFPDTHNRFYQERLCLKHVSCSAELEETGEPSIIELGDVLEACSYYCLQCLEERDAEVPADWEGE